MNPAPDLDRLAITTLRTLCIDAVQQAASGHPGTPMGIAPVAYALWQHVLRFDPADPAWPDRDRFVLSAGHASTLLYALLHVTGTRAVDADERPLDEEAVALDDLKRFRQLDSRTPGHPEYHHTAGVETTSGPLGQGVGNSVGMAIAARWLAATFNRPGFTVVDHDVYALAGDGDMMEGLASEAASLAGQLGLERLCWIYDRNRITIEGSTELAFGEDVGARFRAYGWHVLHVADANDAAAMAEALASFRRTEGRPTLVIVDSHIGFGAPHKQDTAAAHGEPLGEDEVRSAKRAYGWPEDARFLVPDEVRAHVAAGIGRRGADLRAGWHDTFARYRTAHPELADDFERLQRRELPAGWDADLPVFAADAVGVSSRDASGRALNAVAPRVPWLIGGAADLAPSTKTRLTFAGAGDQAADEPGGRNLHFGVREHAMGSILNGMALSKVRPFGAGFLIFSDYARPTLRLSALMKLPVINVYTHDSIGVGEDGPTHQPVEQIASLRAIPGVRVLRPADANEVVEAWRWLMPQRDVPVALILSRQALPTFDRSKTASAAGLAHGAYVLVDAPGGAPEVLLLASGSEVALCVQAQERLAQEGIRTRVVSMPSWELFEAEPQAYRDAVLPPDVTARVAVEQASTFGWERYTGLRGRVLGMRSFGASAPLPALLERFGFTVDAVVAAAKEVR